MKIMHIVEGFGGGVYSFLVDLLNALAEEHEVILVYSIRPQTPENYKEHFHKRVKLVNFEMGRNISPVRDLKNFFDLKGIIKEYNPDIVHLHSSKAGFLGRLVCRALGFKGDKVFYNPHGYSFLQENISKYKRHMYFLLENLAARFGGTVVAVSQGEYLETLKLTREAVRIDNAINDGELKKVLHHGSGEERMTVGTIGRITYQKNPSLFNEIAKRFPQVNFLWIGDGDMRSELNSGNIKVTGWMERYRAIEEMNNIDIYLQTSLWEGMPIALLEAMYLGKVPVVSNVIGNRDVIVHGENGFVCSDLEEYEAFIERLMGDREMYHKMSKNASDYIKENHLVGDMVRKYHGLYEKAC